MSGHDAKNRSSGAKLGGLIMSIRLRRQIPALVAAVTLLAAAPSFAAEDPDEEEGEATFKIFWSTSTSAGDIDPEDGPRMGFRFETDPDGDKGFEGGGPGDINLIELRLWHRDGSRPDFGGIGGNALRPLDPTVDVPDPVGEVDEAWTWQNENAVAPPLETDPAVSLCLSPYGCGEPADESASD